MIQAQRFRKQRRDSEINIAPLIDMVFILLIFFLVTTSFVKETGVEVQRPIASTARHIKKGNILVAVTKDGAIYMENRQVDLHAVRALVKRALQDIPGASVIVIADEYSYTGIVTKVIDECRKAGAKNVNIAARTEE